VTISPKTFCSTKVAVAKVQGYFHEVLGMMAMYGVPFPVLVKGPSAVYSGLTMALRRVNAIRASRRVRVSGGKLTRAIAGVDAVVPELRRRSKTGKLYYYLLATHIVCRLWTAAISSTVLS
jgi:hypothetical protein